MGIGVAFGAIAAFAVVYLFGAGLFAGLLAYSLGGAACTLVAAWFRFRCVEERGEAADKSVVDKKLVAAQ
ncbi:hypothetical protein [Paracoccus zhejiangensis]|uniref:Uncharacterized protein n=1 Tax=Paracoccus zhejiangensis TaxID=1077935 RepID=A0A2H5EX01_9RHOB|nr:hypothetical protein [Paracoccus zhejiangensis]AUH63829.1 hypothetical protein CX676_06370 [Paracoccus zhejiangensis]